MLPEISLSILDIVHNSIRAEANHISIHIVINDSLDLLSFIIEDNGTGMLESVLFQIQDPFYTTRTTRHVGLGIPFLKQQAEITGGNLRIQSIASVGTTITCNYVLSHIDRMPLGDLVSTIHSLITSYEHIRFVFHYEVNKRSFILDTLDLTAILGDISFQHYEISSYIKEYLNEQITKVNQDKIY